MCFRIKKAATCILWGYAANAITSLLCGYAAKVGSCPWFERVASAAQVADTVSRGDLELANSQNWQEVQLDLTEIWQIVRNVIRAGAIATDDHIEALHAAIVRARDKSAAPPADSGGNGIYGQRRRWAWNVPLARGAPRPPPPHCGRKPRRCRRRRCAQVG